MLALVAGISAGLACLAYYANGKDPEEFKEVEIYNFICNCYFCLLPLLWYTISVPTIIMFVITYTICIFKVLYEFVNRVTIGRVKFLEYLIVFIDVAGFTIHMIILIGRLFNGL